MIIAKVVQKGKCKVSNIEYLEIMHQVVEREINDLAKDLELQLQKDNSRFQNESNIFI